jgi:hypothetical protein
MKRVRLKAMHATEINLSSSWHVCFGEKWKEDGNYQTILGWIPRFSINASSVPLRMDVTTILKST